MKAAVYGFITAFAFGLTHHHKCYVRLLAILKLQKKS